MGPGPQALSAPAFQDSLVPFTVSAPEDDAALAALNFDAAGWNDVSAVAAKNHVGEVALVQAVYANGKMTVNIRRLGAGRDADQVQRRCAAAQTRGHHLSRRRPRPRCMPSRICGRPAPRSITPSAAS